MDFLSIFFIACALSADAFVVSLCKGLSVKKVGLKHYVIVAMYFGGFQGIMPLLGYGLGVGFASFMARFDHWIAFLLLSAIGAKMIKESFKEHSCGAEGADFGYKIMLPLGIATSIDALAVGVSLAVLETHIYANALCIAIITAIFSALALNLGNRFGLHFANRFSNKIELLGGVILILIGTKILIEHLIEGI
ncbi:manganese efflux pump MntP [Helicobacter sp. T3_23-1056]